MEMKKEIIVFATGNKDKLREVRAILEDTGWDVISMKEAGFTGEIVEDGATFEENAMIKAKAVMQATGKICLADDSGLEIDYFDKAPGVYSARYLGENTPYIEKNTVILKRLENVPEEKRTARFVCVIACAFPDGRELECRATMEGQIAHEIAGENGFGYDPIFYLPEYGCTSAELSPEEKNKISHRGKALRLMRARLAEI